MDYNKIGEFISQERKAKKLTQAKLAEKLFVSEKTVSKWETVKGIPDTATLPKICELFGVSINEILSGERISTENYVSKAEDKMLKLQNEREYAYKTLFIMECVIGILSLIVLLFPIILVPYLNVSDALRVVIIICAFLIGMAGFFFALRIEQIIGYYQCKHCKHKYVPTYVRVNCAMHLGRLRYMKCPKCKKWSWQKKVIK